MNFKLFNENIYMKPVWNTEKQIYYNYDKYFFVLFEKRNVYWFKKKAR